MQSLGLVPANAQWERWDGGGSEFRPLSDRAFKADCYDPETKTIWEYNGRYWHGPDPRDQDYDKDCLDAKYYQERRRLLTNAGYRLIEMWSHKYYNNMNKCQVEGAWYVTEAVA